MPCGTSCSAAPIVVNAPLAIAVAGIDRAVGPVNRQRRGAVALGCSGRGFKGGSGLQRFLMSGPGPLPSVFQATDRARPGFYKEVPGPAAHPPPATFHRDRTMTLPTQAHCATHAASDSMRVILGAASLKAYVTAPKFMHVLGIVRFGLEYGLLATDPDGDYFRVNGSRLAPLDRHSVGRAIALAQRSGGRFALRPAPAEAAAPLVAPHISVRKYRHVAQGAQA